MTDLYKPKRWPRFERPAREELVVGPPSLYRRCLESLHLTPEDYVKLMQGTAYIHVVQYAGKLSVALIEEEEKE